MGHRLKEKENCCKVHKRKKMDGTRERESEREREREIAKIV